MRRLYLVLIAVAVIVFLAISALLARVWSADGAERSAVTSLIQAEARGDQQAVIARISGCSQRPDCVARATQLAQTLRRAGGVSILQLQSSAGFSLTATTGTARVAWNTSRSAAPFVQCVRVRRAGDALQGLRIELLALSPRIPGGADCPASF